MFTFTENQYLERILKDIHGSSEVSEEELKEEFVCLAYEDEKVTQAREKAWQSNKEPNRKELELIVNQLVERVVNKMLKDFKKTIPTNILENSYIMIIAGILKQA